MVKMGQKRKVKKEKVKRKHALKLYPLDILFSKYIRLKAHLTCEYCGKRGVQLHCHHGVVGRRYRNTRFEEDNASCVCVSCHWFLGDFPKINAEFFRKRIGTERMEQLEVLARSGGKPDLEQIEVYLKKKLRILEGK